MMSGFIQQVPIYQTPEQGQKRESSPLFGSNPENTGKRSRQVTGDKGSTDGSPEPGMRDTYTIHDVMKEFKKLATKEDLVQIKGTMVAQSAEIQQLRGEMEKQGERIKVLEDEMGARAAVEVNRTQRPDVDTRPRMQYGGAQSARPQSQDRRQNIVVHGIKIDKDEDMLETVLDMCQAMNAVVFSSDIADITWLGRFESGMASPPPLRVSFHFQYMRDNILRKKSKLLAKPKFANVFINPDEPLETRRVKGMFRRIAAKAREDGKEVTYRSDWIKINDDIYQASELDRIPKEYMTAETRNLRPKTKASDGKLPEASGGEPESDSKQDQVKDANKEYIVKPNVKMMLTKSGLTFSGKTAFVSNLSSCDFVYRDQPYTSTEQGLQHQNALHHKVTDIAAKIMGTTDTKYIKELSHEIPKSEVWDNMSPGILWDLNDCKFSQNPPLMKQLLDTAPHRLVEASFDSKWGGGAPFGADTYKQGIVPGKNIYGDMATTYRDQKIAQKCLINELT